MTALCGLFYGTNKMATDVDVQYFSHLNGLTLGNNWGDLIRLLDKALVTGIDFTQITAASIDEQGDVHITLYSAHEAMLLQVVELSGFTPSSLNQKYRIKGVPNTTQLILKPAIDIAERSITTIGAGKLASLGYDIIFRDIGDVKRVYRAKNPTAQHPFIRIDESLASDAGTYTAAYAKYAMVGLLEHMDHIDDYQNSNVLQLPFDPTDPAKSWKITGTVTATTRGWSRWYWARSTPPNAASTDAAAPAAGQRSFTLVGDRDCIYFNKALTPVEGVSNLKVLSALGLISSNNRESLIPPWFLMTALRTNSQTTTVNLSASVGGVPLSISESVSAFCMSKINEANPLQDSVNAYPIIPNYTSGGTNIYSATQIPALEIPVHDADQNLRGNLKHVYYSGKFIDAEHAKPTIAENSMYISDTAMVGSGGAIGGFYFYLGEIQ